MDINLSEEFKILHGKLAALVTGTLDPAFYSVEKANKIPEEIVDQLRALGLFGMPIPKEYGGLGLSTLEEILLYEEITKTNACYRSRIGTSNGIGSVGILYDGTEEQKQTYLSRIATGEWTAAFALTEPNAGSDAGGITTSAVLDGDSWVLNGSKIFITNADTANVFTTVAVTDETKGTRGGVSAFIVERESPGLTIGPKDMKMGLKGSVTCELIFKDCRIPKENIIGGMEMLGQGFKTAMRVLDKGRLSIGACALGACEKLLDLAVAHVKKKIAAGKSKADLQVDQFALADMATQMYAARNMLYHTCQLKDAGEIVTDKASMVKIFCTEMASRIAESALDIMEEDGCLTSNQVEILLRDVRLYRIYEGTSEIQRTIVSRELLK
jgi:acyl-CoA dehydrogenase